MLLVTVARNIRYVTAVLCVLQFVVAGAIVTIIVVVLLFTVLEVFPLNKGFWNSSQVVP